MRSLADLHEAITKVCPITGLAGKIGRAPARIDYAASATDAQKAAAQNVIANFDWNAPTAQELKVAAARKHIKDNWASLTETQKALAILINAD